MRFKKSAWRRCDRDVFAILTGCRIQQSSLLRQSLCINVILSVVPEIPRLIVLTVFSRDNHDKRSREIMSPNPTKKRIR
jgi:hypothetical protein